MIDHIDKLSSISCLTIQARETLSETIHKNHRKLSTQLLTGFGLAVLIVGALILGVNYHSMQADFRWQVERRAESINKELTFATEGLVSVGYVSMIERIVMNYGTLPDVEEVAIVTPSGQTLAHNVITWINQPYKTIHPELSSTINDVMKRGKPATRHIVVKNTPSVIAFSPIKSQLFDSTAQHGLVVTRISMKQIQERVFRVFLRSSITLLGAIAVILILMGILLQQFLLKPLWSLNTAIAQSQTIGYFKSPSHLPANEIRFLATTFEKTFRIVSKYEQLQSEIEQRKQAEADLIASEQRERIKSQELETALIQLQSTQLQLIHTEKMSSLGQMVAGIAHEINNPVSFIYGNLDHLRDYTTRLFNLIHLYQSHYPHASPQIQDSLDEYDLEFMEQDYPALLNSMKTGTIRIQAIVKSLRTFSRLDESALKQVNIHEGLEDTLLILQSRLMHTKTHKPIQVMKDYEKLPLVDCYASQLNQVFLNILSNAIDALQDVDFSQAEPTLWLRTRHLERGWVEIQIQDNGPGIAAEHQSRLFDPFFTTKAVGKGTGLGLSISHAIVVDQHHGRLICSSELSRGTVFSIQIPTTVSAFLIG